MKIFIIFLVLLASLSFVWSQSTEVTLFYLEKMALEFLRYPWGEEMRIEVSGIALPNLAGGCLTVSIFYENIRFYAMNIPLTLAEDQEKIQFKLIADPINRAIQQILPGEYRLLVEFNLQNQSMQMAELLKKKLGNRTVKSYEKSGYWGNQQKRDEIVKTLRNFYLQQIAVVNNLLLELSQQQQKAITVRQDVASNRSNPFEKNGNFSRELWDSWWMSFLKKLEAESLLLQKQNNCLLLQIYPVTHTNLLIYNEILEELSRGITVGVYDFYRSGSQASLKPDPERVKKMRDTLRYIREMHYDIAKELRVDLRAHLGYLPPPVK